MNLSERDDENVRADEPEPGTASEAEAEAAAAAAGEPTDADEAAEFAEGHA